MTKYNLNDLEGIKEVKKGLERYSVMNILPEKLADEEHRLTNFRDELSKIEIDINTHREEYVALYGKQKVADSELTLKSILRTIGYALMNIWMRMKEIRRA